MASVETIFFYCPRFVCNIHNFYIIRKLKKENKMERNMDEILDEVFALIFKDKWENREFRCL